MEEVKQPEEKEKTLLSWIAKSQPFKPEEMQMRPILIVIAILITVVLIVAGEWMLLAVIAAGGFYYYAIKRTEPMNVEFVITNKGIRAFGRLYMWWEMKSWWWEEKWKTKLLALELGTGMMGRLYIPIETVRPEEVEKIMNKYLLMQKPLDTWQDKIGRYIKEKFPLENKT
jgi:hypothetical protein